MKILVGADEEPLELGTEVIINAGHMNGMDGAPLKSRLQKRQQFI